MHSKREFLTGAGLVLAAAAASPAFAQSAKKPAADAAEEGRGRKPLPNRKAKTTKLFKAPGPWPNALASSPQGLWVAQQHLTEGEAKGVGCALADQGQGAGLADGHERQGAQDRREQRLQHLGPGLSAMAIFMSAPTPMTRPAASTR